MTKPNHEQLILETPEQVELSLELAGMASRAVACALDTLLQGLIILAALLGLGLLGILDRSHVAQGLASLQDGGMSSSQLPMVLMAVIGVITFGVFWGYHVFFELASGGRTPGKRLLGLRVLRDDGTPITFVESLIRNLVRVIDFLPIYYGVGLIGMLANGRYKRLGDLAAGTLVVRERRRPTALAVPLQPQGRGPVRLEPRLEALVASFLERRHQLDPARRRKLADQLAPPLQARFGGAQLGPEPFLEALLEAHRHGTIPPWTGHAVDPAAASGFGWASPRKDEG